ncbi:MAG TPA: hypothetical protein VGN80_14165 [Devosiaceae bacterium]|nr:hypothetical protein [Devosiaceae bacterium]
MDLSGFWAFLGLVGFAIASLYSPSATINYEVAVTITLDGQPYTGRGVWSMTSEEVQALGYRHIVTTVRGEAIKIPVPDGPQIYALRRSQGSSTRAYGAFPDGCIRGEQRSGLLAAIESFRGPCVVEDYPLPLLVTVEDPMNPASVAPVGSLGSYDKPDACPHICLVEVVVTRSDEPITTGLVSEMPWLAMGYELSEIGTGEEFFPGKAIFPGKLYNQDFTTQSRPSG